MNVKIFRRLAVLTMALVLSVTAVAQTTVRGFLLDTQTRETLIGATVSSDKTKEVATSDNAGLFAITLPAGEQTLTISYLGYETKKMTVSPSGRSLNLGEIELNPSAVSLTEVMVTASVGIARKTPVAISTIPAATIQEVLGTQELPEILNTTPGVYATKQGGGFGDSRINVRGFEAANTAVMVNGVPVNDMEWGGVYWSNWTGLTDVTRSMQVQRGLGAAKIAAPSVGGSINIVTKTTDVEEGGSIYYGMGNDGYNKIAINASTGLMDNGWAVTVLGSKTWGQGYILGTEFEGYSYFLNLSKRINANHELSLTAVGSPQWHNQRYSGDKLLISEWKKYKEGYRYNPTYGSDYYGNRRTANYNYYHKPQISLNHVWTINEKSSLTTSLYTSIGRGGGYAGRGRNSSAFYGTTNGYVNTGYRTNENYFDYGKLMAENEADPNGSLVALTSSTNDHNWYGLLSTYNTKIGENWDLYGGIDLRYYEGIHKGIVMDLMGGKYFIDPSRNVVAAKNRSEYGDPNWYNQRLNVGDVVYRDYSGFVGQAGLFAQAEYSNKAGLSAFVSASFNNNLYWRTDRFYYNNATSDVASHFGWSAKGGANYNINEYHNVFFNVGGFSRTPVYSGGVFLSAVNSNNINAEAKNEKIFSAEVGYGFRSSYLSVNMNAYFTQWYDKTTVRAVDASDPDRGTLNLSGVDARHMGVEVEAVFRPVKNFEMTGMLSVGDWRWIGEAYGLLYNKEGLPVDAKGNVVTNPADQAWAKMQMNDVHVGNSAQTTASLDASYKFFKGFRAGLTWRIFGRNFANYTFPSADFNKTVQVVEPWQIPTGNTFNFRVSYNFKISKLDANLQGNIDNLLDQEYITDANDGSSHDWDTAPVFYGFGRTWSLGLRVRF